MKRHLLCKKGRLIPVVVLLLATACSREEKVDHFDIQGHRGCRGLYPENTIKGFQKAIDIGVTTLEMDVVISKDRRVLLSHDPFLSPEICYDSTGSDIPDSMAMAYALYQMDYEDIAKCDCGSKPHARFPGQVNIVSHKPLLIDVIRDVEAYVKEHKYRPVLYNIETKCTPEGDDVLHPAPGEYVRLLMQAIDEYGIRSRVIIQSFDPRTLHIVREGYPGIPVALLIEDREDFVGNIDEFGSIPDIYSPNYFLVTKELMDFAKHNNMKVIPWTVNDKLTMVKLLDLGVDGMITDYPDVLVEVVEEYRSR